jgi:hypothetical protein
MNTTAAILRELGVTEQHAVREFALRNASQKAAELSLEIEALERKYRMSFAEFERRLQSLDEEVFEEEDDFLAWKFAVEGAAYWREKIEQLQRES